MIYFSTRKSTAPKGAKLAVSIDSFLFFFSFFCSFSFFPCPLLLHTLIPLRGPFARPWRALSQISRESPDFSFSHQACFCNVLEEKLVCLGWIKAPPLCSSSNRRASLGRDVSSVNTSLRKGDPSALNPSCSLPPGGSFLSTQPSPRSMFSPVAPRRTEQCLG